MANLALTKPATTTTARRGKGKGTAAAPAAPAPVAAPAPTPLGGYDQLMALATTRVADTDVSLDAAFFAVANEHKELFASAKPVRQPPQSSVINADAMIASLVGDGNHGRDAIYKKVVPCTVAQAIAAGVKRVDVIWDMRQGRIVVGAPATAQ